MSDAPKSNEHAIAQQTQEKFELYLLSLVFTLLALAIQTATFGPSLLKNSFELCAWLCFLTSGLAGLWRLQWVPVLRVQMAERKDIENQIFKLKELQLQGQTELLVLESGTRQPIADRLVHRNAALAVYDPVISKRERRIFIAYDIHKFGFVLALLLAIASRGFEPGLAIAKHLISRLS
jgi:hypothetical protein